MKSIYYKAAVFIYTIILVLGCCGTVFAADESKVTNSVETSVVRISLSQSQMDEDGVRSETETEYVIAPNKTISLIETVTNEGADCYVRVKISTVVYKDGEKLDIEAPFSVEDIFGLSEKWIAVGDYFYYTEVLEQGTSEDIFDGIVIPADMGNEYAGTDITFAVAAEAVQSDFFTPDFDSAAPWGDLTAEECIREGYDFASLRTAGDSIITVYYEGGASGIVIVPDDFFEQFAAMLPGGTYTGTATVANITDDTMLLYFRTKVTDAENNLLNQLQLSITKKSDNGSELLIYEGSLNSESLSEYILLGTFEGEDRCDLVFTITVPETLKNEYTLLDGSVDWYFMAEIQENESPAEESEAPEELSKEEISTNAPSDQPTNTDTAETSVTGSSVAGRTGDQAHLIVLVIAAIAAMMLMIACIIVSKKRIWERKQYDTDRGAKQKNKH